MKRISDAAAICKADFILEIGGDCPLVDSNIVQNGIDLMLKDSSEFVCNFYPSTFPDE